jgi:hypothetical protein
VTFGGFAAGLASAGPVPLGAADVSLSYTSSTGVVTRSSQVDYSGFSPADAMPLGGDANLGYFGSVNSFGRRTSVPGAIGAEESLLTHAFFKPGDFSGDFFTDITSDSDVTLTVENIQFASPVYFQNDTGLMHKFWSAGQLDAVDLASGFLHSQAHNQDTVTDPFRDFDDFFPAVFSNTPVNYALGTLGSFAVTGNGTNTLGFSLTAPYQIFRHFEEDLGNPLTIPAGLPAPHGFLEPFHFHYEIVVSEVPEPATALLIGLGALAMIRRR